MVTKKKKPSGAARKKAARNPTINASQIKDVLYDKNRLTDKELKELDDDLISNSTNILDDINETIDLLSLEFEKNAATIDILQTTANEIDDAIYAFLHEKNIKAPTAYLKSIVRAFDMENGSIYVSSDQKINLTSNKGINPMAKNGWITSDDGTKKCYKNGELHNLTEAAERRPNGTTLWWKNGKLNRDGGRPAMIAVGGTEKYAVDGKYHRIGGPAITWSKGPFREEWWEHGHIIKAREKDGTVRYYAPGCEERDEALLHSLSGPAVLYPNGVQEYWIDGQFYETYQEWLDAAQVYQTRTTHKYKEKKMNKTSNVAMTEEKPSFTDMMKEDAKSAAYRVAGTQASKAVKAALVQVMRKNGATDGKIQAISEFLDTEVGQGIIQGLLGVVLQYMPHFGEDPRMQRLSKEMRIGGMSTVGNAVIGEAMEHLIPALTTVLKSLPEDSSKRVSTGNTNLAKELMEENESESEMETTKTKTR